MVALLLLLRLLFLGVSGGSQPVLFFFFSTLVYFFYFVRDYTASASSVFSSEKYTLVYFFLFSTQHSSSSSALLSSRVVKRRYTYCRERIFFSDPWKPKPVGLSSPASSVPAYFFFFFSTLVTGPRRSLSFKLSGTRASNTSPPLQPSTPHPHPVSLNRTPLKP